MNSNISTLVEGQRYTSIGNSRFTSANTYSTFINNDKATSGDVRINTSSPNSNVIVENGNVGIGTINPGSKLDVVGNVSVSSFSYLNGATRQNSNDTPLTIKVGNTSYLSSEFSTHGLQLYTGITSNDGTLFMGCDLTNGMNYIQSVRPGFFQTLGLNPKGGNVFINGNVGIGTTNPLQKLCITGSGTNQTRLLFTDTSVGTSRKSWAFAPFDGDFYGFTIGDNGGAGGTNWLEVRRAGSSTDISSVNFPNGNVGIGTSNPRSKLHLEGSSVALGTNLCFIKTGAGSNNLSTDGISDPFSISSSISAVTIGMGVDTTRNTGYINCARSGYTLPIDLNYRQNAGVNIFGTVYQYSGDYRIDGVVKLSSDMRIKNNIVDIDDKSALDTLRLIQPKLYNYIDKNKGTEPVWGFIAQQIRSVLPYSTTIYNQIIPNFYTNCQISETDVSNILLVTSPIDLSWNPLHDACGNVFIDADGNACSDEFGNKQFKIQLCKQSNYKDHMEINIKNIIDSKNFLIDISGIKFEKDEYFLYGQEVDDFHFLDKTAIYTIATAALQDVDRIQQQQVALQQTDAAKIATLEAQVASQDARIAALEQAIAALLATK